VEDKARLVSRHAASAGRHHDARCEQPIWDKSHTYLDAFVAYRTKLFSDKVGLTLQLNARNVTESGHLQPCSRGRRPRHCYRIIDPRLFILTATFSCSRGKTSNDAANHPRPRSCHPLL